MARRSACAVFRASQGGVRGSHAGLRGSHIGTHGFHAGTRGRGGSCPRVGVKGVARLLDRPDMPQQDDVQRVLADVVLIVQKRQPVVVDLVLQVIHQPLHEVRCATHPLERLDKRHRIRLVGVQGPKLLHRLAPHDLREHARAEGAVAHAQDPIQRHAVKNPHVADGAADHGATRNALQLQDLPLAETLVLCASFGCRAAQAARTGSGSLRGVRGFVVR
mmetsp:Transcript_95144/g.275067  ORF Transcript_95144/g.275067 Transcript_95144/m.275067 type:complete len:219 (+) Transcript_95144:1705-2361(+)